LLGLVEPSQHPDYFYVKKIDKSQMLESAYDGNLVELDDSVINHLIPLYNKLLDNIVPYREGYYLTKISTGECLICYDYIWNGPFRDVCKHNHAAKIYQQYQSHIDNLLYHQHVKIDFVNYFKNKQQILPAEKKNDLIYNGDVETAFTELVKIFEIQGNLLLIHQLIAKLLIYLSL